MTDTNGVGITSINTQAVESLAEYAHKAWSGWMRYMFDRSLMNPDGTVTIPSELVARWHRQVSTSYRYLPENEKLSDREEAYSILRVLDSYNK